MYVSQCKLNSKVWNLSGYSDHGSVWSQKLVENIDFWNRVYCKNQFFSIFLKNKHFGPKEPSHH